MRDTVEVAYSVLNYLHTHLYPQLSHILYQITLSPHSQLVTWTSLSLCLLTKQPQTYNPLHHSVTYCSSSLIKSHHTCAYAHLRPYARVHTGACNYVASWLSCPALWRQYLHLPWGSYRVSPALTQHRGLWTSFAFLDDLGLF